MKTKIQNLTNAFICIQDVNEKILIDPWIEDGIYLNTWHNFPRVPEKILKDTIQNVDECLITHLHKDHFNINTIKKLKRKTHIILPKVFGWQVMHHTLKKNNFKNITILECGGETYESKNYFIQSVPAINTNGLEENLDPKTCIDAGFVLTNKYNSLKLVFLADDNLYNGKIIKKNLKLIQNPDLIAFAYSGFATDFPFNYKLSFKDKIKIVTENENKRFKLQCKNLKKIQPKCIMPYSSEFVPVGSHAKNWIKLFPKVWTSSKTKVAKKYAKFLNSNYIDLYPGEFAEFNIEKKIKFKPKYNREIYLKKLTNYYNSIKTNEYKCKKITTPIEILFKSCFINWKKAIKRYNFKPTQNINFYIDDLFFKCLSKKNNNITNTKLKESYLDIYLPKNIFLNLMNGNIHWNDAILSLRLNWDRKPNLYCDDTLSSLNYFRSEKKIV